MKSKTPGTYSGKCNCTSKRYIFFFNGNETFEVLQQRLHCNDCGSRIRTRISKRADKDGYVYSKGTNAAAFGFRFMPAEIKLSVNKSNEKKGD